MCLVGLAVGFPFNPLKVNLFAGDLRTAQLLWGCRKAVVRIRQPLTLPISEEGRVFFEENLFGVAVKENQKDQATLDCLVAWIAEDDGLDGWGLGS